jgi:DNA-binding response OmpR family regulator
VLLVEEDQDLSSLVLAGFAKTEIQVDHASTREEAIAFCQRRRPELMILDLTLPDGDGFSLVEWLSSQPDLQALPLVVYSGRPMSDEERSRLRSEPAKFLARATVQTNVLEELLLTLARQRRHRRTTDFRSRIARLPVS